MCMKKYSITIFILIIIVLSSTIQICLCSEIETEFDNEFSNLLNNITNLKNWQTIPTGKTEKEVLYQNIVEISEKMTNNTDYAKKYMENKDRIWLKHFLKKLNQKLTNYVNDSNQIWNKDYLELVQEFNNAQIRLQTYSEISNNLNFSLDSLRDIRIRIKSIKDVYKQNLKGIPTSFLIIGRREWDPYGQTLQTSYNSIDRGAKHFVIEKLSNNNLIFSKTIVKNARIIQDVVTSYKGGVVEPYETDPIPFQLYNVSHLVQMYRCYPRFNSIQRDDQAEFQIEKDDTQYEHVTSENIFQIVQTWNIKEKHVPKMKEFLKEVEQKNQSSNVILSDFDKKYNVQMNAINEPKLNAEKALKDNIKKIKEIDGIWRMQESVFTLDKYIDLILDLSDIDIEKGIRQRKKINNLLQHIKEHFINQTDIAKQRFTDKIKRRKMIVFTNCHEFFHKSQKSVELNKTLLKNAIEVLRVRKTKLVNFELAVVKDGMLQNEWAYKYYNHGIIKKYFMMPPILTYIDSESARLSFFLAQEVEFVELQNSSIKSVTSLDEKIESMLKNERPSVVTPAKTVYVSKPEVTVNKKLNFMLVTPDNMKWFIHAKNNTIQNITYNSAKKKLPNGYRIPKLIQLKNLRKYLIARNVEGTHAKIFFQLLTTNKGVWTTDIDHIMDKCLTFNFKTNETKYRVFDYLGIIIGVKRK